MDLARTAFALVAAIALSPVQAQANAVIINFQGTGVSGLLDLTFQSNPNVGSLPGTAPNPVDPIGSYVVSGISGTFSDDALNISNAAISGLVPLNRVSPEVTNLLAPNSFSLLPVLHGVPSPGGLSAGLHYDNLFYPAGSPQTASDYPFSGGVFDIYGLVFGIGGSKSVNLWSNGTVPGAGLTYGVAVTNGEDLLDYTSGVNVTAAPEPTSWSLMIIGFGVVGSVMRRKVKLDHSYAG